MTCVTWCYQVGQGTAEMKCTQTAEQTFEEFMADVAEKQEQFPPIKK